MQNLCWISVCGISKCPVLLLTCSVTAALEGCAQAAAVLLQWNAMCHKWDGGRKLIQTLR